MGPPPYSHGPYRIPVYYNSSSKGGSSIIMIVASFTVRLITVLGRRDSAAAATTMAFGGPACDESRLTCLRAVELVLGGVP
jgi:hypothetical protein